MKQYFQMLTSFVLVVSLCQIIKAQCPNVSPIYRDLETWRHSNIQQDGLSHNIIKAQITEISPRRPTGGYFYTSWGRALLWNGVSTYGQCSLSTDHRVRVVRSDRDYQHGQVKQPFSINIGDMSEEVVSLDIVHNIITVKYFNPDSVKRFSNVVRIGNTIYGSSDTGHMIILSLFKTAYNGPILPTYYTEDAN